MGTALANSETKALVRCEGIIERGLGTFREVGQAFMEIRDARLYRGSHKTFAAYCQKRWQFSDSRARQLIAAAKTAETVTNVTVPNEGTARALGKVPKEDRQEVWDAACESAGDSHPTARHVREAAEVLDAGPEPEEADEDWEFIGTELEDIGATIGNRERVAILLDLIAMKARFAGAVTAERLEAIAGELREE